MYLVEIPTNSLLCQRPENIGNKNSLHFYFYTLQELYTLYIFLVNPLSLYLFMMRTDFNTWRFKGEREKRKIHIYQHSRPLRAAPFPIFSSSYWNGFF
jgi:hypothetical protein